MGTTTSRDREIPNPLEIVLQEIESGGLKLDTFERNEIITELRRVPEITLVQARYVSEGRIMYYRVIHGREVPVTYALLQQLARDLAVDVRARRATTRHVQRVQIRVRGNTPDAPIRLYDLNYHDYAALAYLRLSQFWLDTRPTLRLDQYDLVFQQEAWSRVNRLSQQQSLFFDALELDSLSNYTKTWIVRTLVEVLYDPSNPSYRGLGPRLDEAKIDWRNLLRLPSLEYPDDLDETRVSQEAERLLARLRTAAESPPAKRSEGEVVVSVQRRNFELLQSFLDAQALALIRPQLPAASVQLGNPADIRTAVANTLFGDSNRIMTTLTAPGYVPAGRGVAVVLFEGELQIRVDGTDYTLRPGAAARLLPPHNADDFRTLTLLTPAGTWRAALIA